MPKAFALLLLALLLAAPACAQSLDEIRAYIRREEGLRLTPYRDLGGWAIGYGHQISEPRGAITLAQAESLLTTDVARAMQGALRLTPHFEGQPKVVRLMVISLAYNTGVTGYSRFISFRAALNRHDYHAASRYLRQSLWARQLPSRANRYCLTLSDLGQPHRKRP